MTVADRVRSIISEKLGVIHTDISDDKTFDELGADSLDGVTIAMEIEEYFGIDIGDDVIHTTTTVAEAIAAVERIMT